VSPSRRASLPAGQSHKSAGSPASGGGARGPSFSKSAGRRPPAERCSPCRARLKETAVGFEFLRIVERDGGLVYVAQPEGRPPTDFTLTALTAESATFENPAHDFPKVIRYTKRTDGALEASVSDGAQRSQTFVFQRTP
jgi:hypothetical protein